MEAGERQAMIEVSVQPTHIVAGRRVRLAIRFTNTSQGPSSDIVFRLELPPGISLLEGRSRVEIPLIPAGGTHIHEITVEPSKSGEFELTSGNFSYRDQYGVSAYRADFRWKLSVAPGSSARPASPRPAPRPAVGLEDAFSRLPTGVWGEIRVLVQNTSDVALGGVTMDVSGPLRTNGRRSRVLQLCSGATARFTFSVIAEESGQVPVSVRLTFTYPDGLGSIRQVTQEDSLRVVAGQNSVVGPGGTILYLTASPKDPYLKLPPLRTDLEMKKVKERLQLSRTRDQYRIEFCPASEWDDLSQALADYDPQVVHFSGHGDSDGNLLLEDAAGDVALTTPEGLASLFGLHRATITCVIVNACYSERLARAMSQHIDHVVGMRWQIGDEAAIKFSVGFYTGLFAGHPVPEAFKRGLAHIQSSEATRLEYRTPLLLPEP
ncbi:MAG: CHAT domain-containing protein [Streptosporangiaceae bacterium]